MASATPERFGDYDLVERLGVGGMAETSVVIRRGPGVGPLAMFTVPRFIGFDFTWLSHRQVTECA